MDRRLRQQNIPARKGAATSSKASKRSLSL